MGNAEPLGVDLTRDGDRLRVAVRGELDLLAAPHLRTELLEATKEDPAAIGLDLSAVTFIDSTGISVILQAWQRASANGSRLVVDSASPVVARVIEVAGLTELLGAES
jgi:anti-sigma B factor antagonist